MKVLSVISQKGGVGKTTLATALAVQASQAGRAAQEIEPDGKAAHEMQELYAYVCMNLDKHEQGDGRDEKRAASGAR